jgi:UDP-N-acetylglucosamine 2-epimerase (non-hydrolysing)
MIKKLEKTFLDYKFDLVMVYGDTNSTFAGSFAAKQNKLKVAHIESGLRSYDKNMPEEINRILTDHISDYHYAPTKTALKNLEKENITNVIYTGDLSVEILEIAKKNIKNSNILTKYGLEPKEYILCTLHRAENTNFVNLNIFINIFKELNEKVIFPIHPRTLKTLKETKLLNQLINCKNVILTEPLGYMDFLSIMKNAQKILTDSGGVQKEAYLLETPCITTRNNTEWTETVEQKWNILVGMNKKK